ncbi:hypothetical protein AVEN_126761-1 [Araneus ventricosus]|uniref:Histone-lysine N-methyltransferase SETMAR n=1 Tax=Araneus ventricosus TaxID=182803 RepID=A0A4Y2HZQ9_ARAVE|nr:hypothetical protein AVEN_126761-1 [Araneus ventricosus]
MMQVPARIDIFNVGLLSSHWGLGKEFDSHATKNVVWKILYISLTPLYDHPPYTPDLAPSDFHLFLKLKEFLGGKRFGSDEELENAVTTWLNELVAEEYDVEIPKLVNRYNKCLNVGGDYVEK